jgi:hypothetical protein
VQGSGGKYFDDNSGGQSCAQVDKENAQQVPSVTVTATLTAQNQASGWLSSLAAGIVRWGKLGGPEHRAAIERVSRALAENGFRVDREVRILTPNGAKSSRYVDVFGTKNGEARMYQIGRQNLNGTPVAREVQALDDIEGATGVRPTFLPYNVGEPTPVVPGAVDTPIAPEGTAPGEPDVPLDTDFIPPL